ncbi:TRAP transporter large permease [Yoonia sediminilitoris]|uniref:TRAP transporter large permease protein n=1 Tax=Yoonia sediminilitoris TaxID=1286148 RepID=A0A2T6KBW7_9RHOB|nr:TRAP transporter large permease subunit [Yoonia sediminilitoris]PUB12375.1 tripartite ATP-independent transporter DctM subunit [Yoonia sediminilitoris]RCW93069.1 tripartite ATP-independent transporter DctM subunit [Yoonia sediminilitoris]
MFEIAIVASLLFVALLAGSVWIGLSLFATGYLLLAIFKPNIPMDVFSGGVIWGSLIPTPLLSLPLFILMSEVLVSAGLGRSLFSGLSPWVRRLPGGLLHVNVAGSTLFAAVSGSSAATTAIVGNVSLPELKARGYDRQLAMGSLAGAGTLGFLIPPSIIMIIYGVVAEQSIVELFIAGVIPGLTLAALYMVYIAAHQSLTGTQPMAEPATRAELWRGLRDIGPIAALIVTIMAALYLGFASVSELAALGVLGAVLISVMMGRFSIASMLSAGRRAVRTSAMIGLIVVGAALLNSAFGFLGIPKAIAAQIAGFGLSPMALVAVLLVFYALLGMFLDGTSIIVMTLPITLPLITAAGFDPIWFGIFVVVAVEISQITPPIGFNLFVIQSQTGESIGKIAVAALPFFGILLFFAMLLAVFPDLALWLPRTLQ